MRKKVPNAMKIGALVRGEGWNQNWFGKLRKGEWQAKAKVIKGNR